MRMLLAALAMLLPAAAQACGGALICTVKDPTGTPLNIRASAQGRIIGTAPNGTRLEFIDHVEVDGKTWARVGKFDAGTETITADQAWVFAAYLACSGDIAAAAPDAEIPCRVKDPTGTPLNTRDSPNGTINGSLRNGEAIRVVKVETHGGKAWALAWRDPSDNPVGWVYDAYMICEEDG